MRAESYHCTRRRLIGWILILIPILFSVASANQPVTKSAVSDDLLEFLPVWTSGILEVRNLDSQSDKLSLLFSIIGDDCDDCIDNTSQTKPHTKLASQFDKLIRNNLGISSDKFLHDIIGSHFVLSWGGVSMPDQFGLICKVDDYSAIASLLTSAKAQPIKNTSSQPAKSGYSIKKYQLACKNIRAAVLNNKLLILATVAKKSGASMFDSMVDIASGALTKNFTDRPTVQTIINNIKPNYSLLFALLADGGKKLNRKSRHSLFGKLLSSLDYFAIAGYPDRKIIKIRILSKLSQYDRAFWPDSFIKFNPQLTSMMQMPADFMYLTSINPLRWYHRIAELADASQIDAKQYRQMVELLIPDDQLREDFFESLGPELLILIGSYDKSVLSTQPTSMPAEPTNFPDVTVAIKTNNPAVTADAVKQIFGFLADFITIQNIAGNHSPNPLTHKHMYNGFVVHTLDVSDIFGGKDSPAFTHQLCWCLADEYLIVSTRQEALYELIDRTFEPEKFSDAQSSVNIKTDRPVNWIAQFKPANLARRIDAFTGRLNQFQQSFNFPIPHNKSAGRYRVILGIGTKIEKDTKTNEPILKVAAVLPGYPAWDKIQIGDVIVAINGKPLENTTNASSLSARISQALKHSRKIKITVIRGKILKEITITIPKITIAPPRMNALKLLKRMLDTAARYYQTVTISSIKAKAGEVNIIITAKRSIADN